MEMQAMFSDRPSLMHTGTGSRVSVSGKSELEVVAMARCIVGRRNATVIFVAVGCFSRVAEGLRASEYFNAAVRRTFAQPLVRKRQKLRLKLSAELVSGVDRVERFRLTLRFFDDVSTAS